MRRSHIMKTILTQTQQAFASWRSQDHRRYSDPSLKEQAVKCLDHNLSLSVDDLKLLWLAISTLCTLQVKMEQKDIFRQTINQCHICSLGGKHANT